MTYSSDSASTNASSISSRRTSQPWTGAENAAGFVLRYLLPMRELLIQTIGSETIADESLKRLISHLVAQGFGANGKGRIRDFLMRGVRSAAKSVISEVPAEKRPGVDFNEWTPDSPTWIAIWRKGLLTRAWRGLERIEHKDEAKPLYTILRAATEHPEEDVTMLAIRVNTKTGLRLEPAAIREHLIAARTVFSQLLEHEIAETLDQVDHGSVMQEVQNLGLTGIFVTSPS
ncbi:MAG: hypothetical protein ACO1RT_13810 [Planctomycetaceae bacterium]